MGHGSKISVAKDAVVEFGDNFNITAESAIVSKKKISFGNNVLISWDCLIMDTDWHKIFTDGDYSNKDKEICIGDNVWIGCRTTILKGVNIKSGCVVAANSNVTRCFQEENIIIGGNPVKKIAENIKWTP